MKLERYRANPILTASDFVPCDSELKVVLAFNPGVAKYDNQTVLLVRVAVAAAPRENCVGVPVYNTATGSFDKKYFSKNDPSCDFSDARLVKQDGKVYLTTLSYLAVCFSDDGVNFTVRQTPFIVGDNDYETFGVEDARITQIGNDYYINYSGVSDDGICTMLAVTQDFSSVQKLGVAFMPDNKDVVIFPQKINGEYVALSRPESAYFGKPTIWISRSTDLIGWGKHKRFASLRADVFDSARIGASCVPFLTEKGWVEIYHGADRNNTYVLGAMLLDKEDPSVILARTDKPILSPDAPYEKDGFMPNVVFSCGCAVDDRKVRLYYGACDETICCCKFSVDDLLNELV